MTSAVTVTETMPDGRRRRVVVTVVAGVLLPLSVYVALAATLATVMAVASGGEYGVTGFALVAAGLLLMATPVIVLVAVALMWIWGRRGREDLARRAAWLPLPLQVLGLVTYGVLVTL